MLFKHHKNSLKIIMHSLFPGLYISINRNRHTVKIKRTWYSFRRQVFDIDYILRNLVIPAIVHLDSKSDSRSLYAKLIDILNTSSIYDSIEMIYVELRGKTITRIPDENIIDNLNMMENMAQNLNKPIISWPSFKKEEPAEVKPPEIMSYHEAIYGKTENFYDVDNCAIIDTLRKIEMGEAVSFKDIVCT